MGKYYIISKIPNIPYREYKGNAIRLSKQSPAKVDEVIIGLENAPNVIKKITTFIDKQGNIIERAFDYSGEPLKNRFYKLLLDKVYKNSDILRSSEIQEYSLPRKFLHKFLKRFQGKKLDLWTPDKIETHHVKEVAKTGKKVHSMTRITDIGKWQIPTHTIIEFPHKKESGNGLTPKKFLQFRVNPLDNSVISDSFVAQNVKIPQNDSFLGFRILEIEALKDPITKRFIREHGLADMNVRVGVCKYKAKDGHTISARFTPWSGVVEYNKLFQHKSKAALVNTARHEVEHAWQYYLNARNGYGTEPWEIAIYKKFGDIFLSPRLQIEADKYSEAISNYVSVDKNPEKYFHSLIEVLARKAGMVAEAKYNIEGYGIRSSFPNIPTELL